MERELAVAKAEPCMSGASSQVSDPGIHPLANQKLFLTPHSLSVVHSKSAHLPVLGQSGPYLLGALGTTSSCHWPLGPAGAIQHPRARAYHLVQERMAPRLW